MVRALFSKVWMEYKVFLCEIIEVEGKSRNLKMLGVRKDIYSAHSPPSLSPSLSNKENYQLLDVILMYLSEPRAGTTVQTNHSIGAVN